MQLPDPGTPQRTQLELYSGVHGSSVINHGDMPRVLTMLGMLICSSGQTDGLNHILDVQSYRGVVATLTHYVNTDSKDYNYCELVTFSRTGNLGSDGTNIYLPVRAVFRQHFWS